MAFNFNQTFDSSTFTRSSEYAAYLAALNDKSDTFAKDTLLEDVKAQEYDSPEDLEAELDNYSIPDTVFTSASRLQSRPGTIFLIRNIIDNHTQRLKKLQDEERQEWHTFVVHIKQGVMGLYDPSYEEDGKVTTCISEQTGVRLAIKLVGRLKEIGKKVKEVWIGGGGNADQMYDDSEMSRKWLYEELVVKNGMELGNWEEREWKKLRPI
ncbi:hypothetical protein K440DRAFT_663727 [Wilcoxina mikolae CBS 423.85]|nr:hypothetical protein K440DRAFT_663727 [Wilcoxina mikolae CBS 423.85]